jgi:alkylhydroperoxidase family enzyme
MGGHSKFLVQEFGLERDTVIAIREGREVPGFTPKEMALVKFARLAAANPRQIAADDVSELKKVGLSNAEIVEAVSIVMLSAFTNTLANTFKLDEDLETFKMRDQYF